MTPKDELYLKMLNALEPDTFKDWNWRAGDKGIVSGKTVLVLGTQNEYVWYYDRGELIFSLEYIKNDVAMIPKSEIRPIPSQEQLQEMYDLDWWTFYSQIIHGVVEYDDDESILCVCLRNIMRYNHQKIWTGEAWI